MIRPAAALAMTAVCALSAVAQDKLTRLGPPAGQPAGPNQVWAPRSTPGIGQGFLLSTNTATDINAVVGAPGAYSAGFTGSRSIIANIEGGTAWNGFEALTSVQTYIANPGSLQPTSTPAQAAFDGHATGVTQVIGGRNTQVNPNARQVGVAPGSTLWTGAVATALFSDGSFAAPFTQQVQPYRTAIRTGIGGATADVVNSSWGYYGDPAAITAGPTALDAMIRNSGQTAPARVVVFAAGNAGIVPVSGYSAAYNVITVAALANDTGAPRYRAPATFSSRGLSDTFVPATQAGLTGFFFAETRYKVDIAAPGQNMQVAGSFPSGNPTSPNRYEDAQGTSVAAPAVAAGAGILIDAAKANAHAQGPDARVVKAVLLTSADKTPGWNNGQTTLANGLVRTVTALDQSVGAGRMNVNAGVQFYTNGQFTRDVGGTASGDLGTVQTDGWDYGRVTTSTANRYALSRDMLAGSKFTATLTWFVDRGFNESTLDPASFAENKLADLDLEVWRLDANGNFLTKVGESITEFNNTEHLSLDITQTGRYGLRVVYFGDNWNFVGSTNELYGLAWMYTPVPEPAGVLAVAAGGLWLVRRVRRRAA